MSGGEGWSMNLCVKDGDVGIRVPAGMSRSLALLGHSMDE